MIEIAMRRQGARLIPVDELSADSLVSVPADKDVLVKVSSPQNLKLLRKLWALAAKVAESCDHLHDREDAMDELKIRARHIKYVVSSVTGEFQIVPKSLTKLDGAGLSRLADRMMHVICRDIVPGMDENALRAEIMEMVGGGDNRSNSSSYRPQTGETDKPAAEDSPLPEVAGDQSELSAAHTEPGNVEARAGDPGGDAGPQPTLPGGWEILYAAALRRAQKIESLGRYATEFWKQYGGWPMHKDGPSGSTAVAIYDAFNKHFGNREAIEDVLREIF
jgi:hypothetical protein